MIESTKQLKEAQAKEDPPEARASLPTLSVSDLDREVKRIPIEITEVQGVEVVKHDVPSSGERPSFFFFQFWREGVYFSLFYQFFSL